MIEYVQVAFLRKSHGVKGFIHIAMEEVFEQDIMNAKALFVEHRKKKVPYFIDSIELGGKDIIKFEEFKTPEDVKMLSQKAVFLPKNQISDFKEKTQPVLTANDLLVGFKLIDQASTEIGLISEIIEMPQQEMAVVTYQEKEVLIPLNEDSILDINQEQKTIQVEIIEGLLDL